MGVCGRYRDALAGLMLRRGGSLEHIRSWTTAPEFTARAVRDQWAWLDGVEPRPSTAEPGSAHWENGYDGEHSTASCVTECSWTGRLVPTRCAEAQRADRAAIGEDTTMPSIPTARWHSSP